MIDYKNIMIEKQQINNIQIFINVLNLSHLMIE